MHPSGHVAVCYNPLREPCIICQYFISGFMSDIYSHKKEDSHPTRPTYAHVSSLSITSLRSGQLNPPYDTLPCLYLGTRSQTERMPLVYVQNTRGRRDVGEEVGSLTRTRGSHPLFGPSGSKVGIRRSPGCTPRLSAVCALHRCADWAPTTK
jgi:hypothetical protein